MTDHKEPIRNFFKYMGIGFLVSCIKTTYDATHPIEVVKTLFYTLMYNLIIGIWVGVAGLLGTGLYYSIKKNLRNEPYWG